MTYVVLTQVLVSLTNLGTIIKSEVNDLDGLKGMLSARSEGMTSPIEKVRVAGARRAWPI
jgi:hypothetical protein